MTYRAFITARFPPQHIGYLTPDYLQPLTYHSLRSGTCSALFIPDSRHLPLIHLFQKPPPNKAPRHCFFKQDNKDNPANIELLGLLVTAYLPSTPDNTVLIPQALVLLASQRHSHPFGTAAHCPSRIPSLPSSPATILNTPDYRQVLSLLAYHSLLFIPDSRPLPVSYLFENPFNESLRR
ncbi:hypothetical protein B0H34DRAFT_732332 [Crassisporium funariophilum]|nr:hypothetical protein B0H34DRAFT_732332 [Crassisporium funariophilum]